MENLPLTDVRILELAQGIAGPFCTMLLGAAQSSFLTA